MILLRPPQKAEWPTIGPPGVPQGQMLITKQNVAPGSAVNPDQPVILDIVQPPD